MVLEEDGQRLDQDLQTRAGEQQQRDRLGSVRRLSEKSALKSLLGFFVKAAAPGRPL